MKKYIYPSLVVFLFLSLFVFISLQSSQITHYKELYFDTNKILEDHFVDMHSVSNAGVVIVVHEKSESKESKL